MDKDPSRADIESIAQQISEEEKVFKGSPRSKLVEAIFLLLYARPLRSSEIAINLGYETKYISSYLSYWRKKGLVYQEGGRWHLSRKGEDIAREIIDAYNNSKFKEYLVLAKQVLENEKVNQTKNDKNRGENDKKEQEILWFIEGKTSNENNKPQKARLMDCIKDLLKKLDNNEREILEYLLNKYREWGTTYIYLDQLQEELKADTTWLIRVLKNLQIKRLLYVYQDPKMGVRIGLAKPLKEKLSTC